MDFYACNQGKTAKNFSTAYNGKKPHNGLTRQKLLNVARCTNMPASCASPFLPHRTPRTGTSANKSATDCRMTFDLAKQPRVALPQPLPARHQTNRQSRSRPALRKGHKAARELRARHSAGHRETNPTYRPYCPDFDRQPQCAGHYRWRWHRLGYGRRCWRPQPALGA